MEGSIGSRVCRGVRSCWARRRSLGGFHYYQRLPGVAAPAPGGRGVGLSRHRPWRPGMPLRRRRWSSPLRLVHRIVGACVGSVLSRPLRVLRAAGVLLSPPAAPSSLSSSPPRKLRSSSSRRGAGAGGERGVVLNICVAEVLLRRSASEVRRSPLQQQQQPRKHAAAARSASVRA